MDEFETAPVYDCVMTWNDTYCGEEDGYAYYEHGGSNGIIYKVLLENNHVDLADIANKPEHAVIDEKGFLIGWDFDD